MSFLYPLLLAGVAAMAVPIVLHMIRRHTRHRVAFSSLMFLRTTMPRFKSRSRLEHIPLLIVRCLIVCLLALAFARPFLVRPAAMKQVRPHRRVVILIDTSASMRRESAWARAMAEAKSVLADLDPADRLCVMSFDRTPRILIGFEQWAAMDPTQRVTLAARSVTSLSPGWAATDLGHALIAAAEAIEDDEVNDSRQGAGIRRVVLISDMQRGSNLDALAAYEWPGQMQLLVKAIPCKGATNASLQWITSRDALALAGSDEPPAVRVTNSSDADQDRFHLQWDDGQQTQVYVPAGHSVVLRAPADPNEPTITKAVLTGDDFDFDNTLHLAPQPQRKFSIVYVGKDDPNDTRGMLYYLHRAFGAGSALTASVTRHPGNETLRAADVETAGMIVVTDAIDGQSATLLHRYIESGGILLLVMKSIETAATLHALTGIEKIQCHEADAGQYAMLGQIELDHPLLKPFSDPRFGDFTRIHFWKHRRIDAAACPGARVLASFDNGDPAWLEVPVGRGSLLVWTSGWHPSDSDLALSSKFVPLLYSALEYGGAFAGYQPQYFVGDPVPVPEQATSASENVDIRRPDGTIVRLDIGQRTFTQTDLPGVYAVISPDNEQRFAVNLPAGESRTTPLPVEDIERMGVSLATPGPYPNYEARVTSHETRATRSEMESRQKLWRWALVATLVVLLAEIWLGGRLTRSGPASQEEQA